MTRDHEEGPFAKNLFGSFVRTFVWSVGEVENFDFAPEAQRKDNRSSLKDLDITYHTKAEEGLSKFILLIFIFLFVIVMMNVLNAFAIGDIQVNLVLLMTFH